jgi:hypothetical protein
VVRGVYSALKKKLACFAGVSKNGRSSIIFKGLPAAEREGVFKILDHAPFTQ